jgi:hypothetical protein
MLQRGAVKGGFIVNSSIEKEVLEQLNKLPFEQQQQVLNFARSLTANQVVGVRGKELLRFAGTIEKTSPPQYSSRSSDFLSSSRYCSSVYRYSGFADIASPLSILICW